MFLRLTCFANSEKLMKLDAKRREYDVVVIGEEPHLAYNRVGLTSFFQHRKVENLYLNPKEWVQAPTIMARVLSPIFPRSPADVSMTVLECARRLIELPLEHPRH
jgi:hypothetical protein